MASVCRLRKHTDVSPEELESYICSSVSVTLLPGKQLWKPLFFICRWWSVLDSGNKMSSLYLTNARSSHLNGGYTLFSTALLSSLSNFTHFDSTVRDLFVFIGLGSSGWFGHFLETDWLRRVAQLRSSLLLEVLIQIFDRFHKDQDIFFIARGLSGTLSVWEATTTNHKPQKGAWGP